MPFFAAKDHVNDILAKSSDAQHDDRFRGLCVLVREFIDLTPASRKLGINCSCEFRETIQTHCQGENQVENDTTHYS